MSRHNPSRMRQSLVGRELSTRLRNCLVNMAAYSGGPAKWEDLVERYKHNPEALHVQFLRTPGAGKATWNELVEALKPELHGLDYTGKIVWLTAAEVDMMRTAVSQCKIAAPHHEDAIMKLLAVLRAQTIHLGPA